MKKVIFSFVFIFIAGILAACAQATSEPVSYTIEMSEFAFSPSTVEVKVGQPVTLEVINNGSLEHEIMFGQQVTLMENRPNGYMTEMFTSAGVDPETMMGTDTMEGMHEESHSGFMVVLPETGDRATITFTPTEKMVGEWEMGCFEQEGVHYDAGMKGTLVVQP